MFVLLLFLQFIVCSTIAQEPVLTEIPIDSEVYKLSYILDLENEFVTFEITVATTGYVGLGFSKYSGMNNSDIFIAGVNDEDGMPFSGDYFSTSPSTPLRDEQEDWELISASQNEGSTTISVKRVFNTGDDEMDVPITDSFMTIIWAFSQNDNLSYHTRANRGSLKFNLFSGETPTATPPETTATTPVETTDLTSTAMPIIDVEIPLHTALMTVTYSIIGETATFTAIAKTKGFIGFGFSLTGGMDHADIVVAGFDEANSRGYIEDYFSLDYTRPILDSQQDWDLISASQVEDETTVVFSRKLDTGDSADLLIESRDVQVIWAIGPEDQLDYHGFNRGQVSFNFMPQPVTTPPTPSQEIPFESDLIKVFYEVQLEEGKVAFSARAKTTGFVGFGFSRGGGMVDADIFVGGFDGETGFSYFGDYHANGPSTPIQDKRTDWTLLSSWEEGGETFLNFERALDTGDEVEDVVIENKEMLIIWALGTTDRLGYHNANRGQVSFNLLNEEIVPTPAPITGEIPLNSDLINVTYGISDDGRIEFTAVARTSGYVGFGFSNSSGMLNSDMMIAGVKEDGEIYSGDYKTVGEFVPQEDSRKDWFLITGSYSEGITTLRFVRLLNTGDYFDDIQIEDKDMAVIWAVGNSDIIEQHGNDKRGQTRYNLIRGTGPTVPTSDPSETTTPGPTVSTPAPTPGEIPLGTDRLRISFDIVDDIITFTARAKSEGYIGFGFSNSSGMSDADIIMMTVGGDGTFDLFSDRYGIGPALPAEDTSQDWNPISAQVTDGETICVFSRPLVTGDEHDVPIEDKEMTIIWALGLSKELIYHRDSRGQVKYNLIENPGTLPPLDPLPNEIPLTTTDLTITYEIVGDEITFQAVGRTAGFIGFGFSNISGMNSSDFFIGGVYDYGSVYNFDGHSTAEFYPGMVRHDSQGDWVLVQGDEVGGLTRLVFKRKLVTTDLEQDIPIEDKDMTIIWAIGTTDEILYHGPDKRGQTIFNLVRGTGPTQPTIEPSGPTTEAPSKPGEIPLGTDRLRVSFDIAGDTITFTARAKSKGYIGFGFSNSSGMSDADIVIMGVASNEPYFSDRYGTGQELPTVDTNENWDLISAQETGDETICVFSRLLVTEDEHDVPIENKEMTIIWALGTDDNVVQHAADSRGQVQYNLIENPGALPHLDPLPAEIPLTETDLNITYEIKGDEITFQAVGRTAGFIGFGFSNISGMNTSDFFIGGVLDDGNSYHLDGYSTADNEEGHTMIRNDLQEDWDLVQGEEAGGLTRLIFKRKLVTSDWKEDIPIEDKDMTIIWALGFSDHITYHGEIHRGQLNFNLIRGAESSGSKLFISSASVLIALLAGIFCTLVN